MTENNSVKPFFSYPEDGSLKGLVAGVTQINFANGKIKLANGVEDAILNTLEHTGEEKIHSFYISNSVDVIIQLDEKPKISLAAGQWVMRSVGFTTLRIICTGATNVFINASASQDNIIDVRSGMTISIANLDVALSTRAAETTLASVKTAVETIDNFISGSKGLVTEDNSGAIKTAVELIDNPVKVDDAAFTPAADSVMMIGAEFDDTTPDSVDEGDAGAVRMSAARSLHTKEDNSAAIKTAIEILDNIVSGARGLVTEDNSGAIKTAVELIDNFISGARGLVTEDNSAAILTALQIIDDWDSSDKCKTEEQFSGAFYSKNFTAPDAASEAPIEGSAKKLRDVVIKNTHATYEAEIRENSGDFVELSAGATTGFTHIDLNTVYVKAQTDAENPVLDIWGSEV